MKVKTEFSLTEYCSLVLNIELKPCKSVGVCVCKANFNWLQKQSDHSALLARAKGFQWLVNWYKVRGRYKMSRFLFEILFVFENEQAAKQERTLNWRVPAWGISKPNRK